LSAEEQEGLRLFDDSKILMLTGLSDLKLYNPETDECLKHGEDIPNFVASRDPEVSILITTYNRLGYLFNCLSSIKASCRTYEGRYEVIVVDDASTDRTSWLLSRIRGLKVVSLETNMGFVRANNLGAVKARGDQVILLNNDTIVASGWLKHLLQSFRAHSEVGAVGSKLVYPSGILQEAGAIIWNDAAGWTYGRYDNPEKSEYQHVREVDYCSGASLAVHRSLIRRAGIFDERFHPGYYEDTDLCFYVRSKKKRVLYQPRSVVVHFEGVSHGRETSAGIKKYQVVNRDKFLKKWKLALQKQFSPDSRSVLRARDRASRKSILVFDGRVLEPDTNSGDLRMYSILNLLRSLSWNVTFFPANRLCHENYADDLRQRGIEVLCEPTPVEDFLRQRRNYYDLVLMSRVVVAGQYIDAVILWTPQSVLVIDFPDLQSVRESRYAKLTRDDQRAVSAQKISLKEMELARLADLVITITETERNRLLGRDSHLRIEVIPNVHSMGLDGASFDERRDLLFVGGYEHPPNVDAALFMVNEIFPLIRKRLRNVQLLVVGSKMPAGLRNIQAPDVRMLGYVKDLSPLLGSCKVFVCPLRYGAGLKGKIGMAMAAGLPVVTSSIGAEGMKDSRRKLFLVADSPEDFTNCVVRLYTDRTLWKAVSRDARSYVKQRFSPEVIKLKLLRLAEVPPVNLPRRLSRAFENAAKSYEQVRTEIGAKDAKLQGLEAQLSRSMAELAMANRRLDDVRHSAGYKFMQFYARKIDRLFPDGTSRGRFRKVMTRSIQIVTERGLRTYCRLALDKIMAREFVLAEDVQERNSKKDFMPQKPS